MLFAAFGKQTAAFCRVLPSWMDGRSTTTTDPSRLPPSMAGGFLRMTRPWLGRAGPLGKLREVGGGWVRCLCHVGLPFRPLPAAFFVKATYLLSDRSHWRFLAGFGI